MLRPVFLGMYLHALPSYVFTDGNGGSTVLDLDFIASDSHSVNIPSDGIRVSDIYVSAFTNITAMTVFYN